MADRGYQIDRYDRAILSILQENNKLSHSRIGETVNLSTAAVQRRIRNLERIGVIRANVALVDQARVGRPLTLLVGVKLQNEQNVALRATRKALEQCRQIQQWYYVTGEIDFFIVMNVRDMAEFEEVAEKYFREDRNIREYRTYVVMNSIKSGLSVPLDEVN